MARKNRLNLNFSLRTTTERSEWLSHYLESPEFQAVPPSNDELETMAKFLLWGEDPETGLNGRQAGNFELETKYGTWDASACESLDVLMETPTFNEASVSEVGVMAPLRKKREVFDRKKEFERAGEMTDALKDLWQRIDETDYQIEFYEIEHGRRTRQIRDELINNLTDLGVDFTKLEEATRHWGQAVYLKKKHELVELRREQYTLRDIYAPISAVSVEREINSYSAPAPDFGAGITVLPLGLNQPSSPIARLLFRPFSDLGPYFEEVELKMMSDEYWKGQNFRGAPGDRYIDFRNAFHVQKLVGQIAALTLAVNPEDITSNTQALVDTFWYYVKEANLEDHLSDILEMKIKGEKNTEIAAAVNAKYGKSYTTNYISTIFCGKIVEKICEAANKHVRLIENVWFPEEWKKCTRCGKLLLRDPSNFTRKSRSADGLNSRCKQCEKEIRQGRS